MKFATIIVLIASVAFVSAQAPEVSGTGFVVDNILKPLLQDIQQGSLTMLQQILQGMIPGIGKRQLPDVSGTGFVYDNIVKPLLNDIKDGSISFISQQLSSLILSSLGIGKRDLTTDIMAKFEAQLNDLLNNSFLSDLVYNILSNVAVRHKTAIEIFEDLCLSYSDSTLSYVTVYGWMSRFAEALAGPRSVTIRTQKIQVLTDINTNINSMVSQLKAGAKYLSVDQAIVTNFNYNLDKFGQTLIQTLTSIVEKLMEKAKSAAERRNFTIPGLSLVPDFSQIKELFLHSLEEIQRN